MIRKLDLEVNRKKGVVLNPVVIRKNPVMEKKVPRKKGARMAPRADLERNRERAQERKELDRDLALVLRRKIKSVVHRFSILVHLLFIP